jgi:hypothetical protein
MSGESGRERAYELYPQAREYPSFTDRPLPLVALEPVTEPANANRR